MIIDSVYAAQSVGRRVASNIRLTLRLAVRCTEKSELFLTFFPSDDANVMDYIYVVRNEEKDSNDCEYYVYQTVEKFS